jgi:hypothetical protein
VLSSSSAESQLVQLGGHSDTVKDVKSRTWNLRELRRLKPLPVNDC